MSITTASDIKRTNRSLFFVFLILLAFSVPSSASTISIGSDYGGGKIAYIFQPGDPDYIAGQQRGIIVANKEISGTYNWASAVSACETLNQNGFDDWRLPSKSELEKIYANRNALGDFSVEEYWSSTENYEGNAWGLYFGDGYHYFSSKANTGRALPVRLFSIPSGNYSPKQASGSHK
ncbi:MAG: DUF1566 domain-containing protein [Chlorobium phaeobacteroides]|jgi:hypothetical protein|nr:DUF1566 domain-containing protein [Chlorobium phaeobacteroides]